MGDISAAPKHQAHPTSRRPTPTADSPSQGSKAWRPGRAGGSQGQEQPGTGPVCTFLDFGNFSQPVFSSYQDIS